MLIGTLYENICGEAAACSYAYVDPLKFGTYMYTVIRGCSLSWEWVLAGYCATCSYSYSQLMNIPASFATAKISSHCLLCTLKTYFHNDYNNRVTLYHLFDVHACTVVYDTCTYIYWPLP